MKCTSNFTDRFVPGITLFTQIIVSFLVEKKYKCLSLTDWQLVLEHREGLLLKTDFSSLLVSNWLIDSLESLAN